MVMGHRARRVNPVGQGACCMATAAMVVPARSRALPVVLVGPRG